MTGKKITQLGDGGALQSFDRIPISRGNINRYLNGNSFAIPSDITNLQSQINGLSFVPPTVVAPLTSLPTNNILIGDSSNTPVKRPMGGDVTLAQNSMIALATINPHVVTYNKMQQVSTGNRLLGSTINNADVQEVQVNTSMILDEAVQFSKIQKSTASNVVLGAVAAGATFSEYKVSNDMLDQVSSPSLKGRSSSGVGPVEDLTPAQVRAILNVSSGAGPNVPTDLSLIQTSPSLVHLDSSTQITPGIDILSATAMHAGVMTSNDRIKLDGIATGATSNTGTVEQIESDSPINVIAGSSGNVTRTPKITIDPASHTNDGTLSKADKIKLDGLAFGANNYSHPNHTGVITSAGDGQTFWNDTLPAIHGGTGYTSYSDGEILIGDSTAAGGTTLKKSTLTEDYGVKVTNGPGSIGLGLNFDMVGMIASFYRNGTAPAGWLPCDGSLIPAGAQYNALRVQIGAYTPDMRGMFLVGVGPNPDASLAYNYPLGSTGGQARVKMSVAEMPIHNHTVTDPGHTHTATDSGHTHTGTTDTDGSHVHRYEARLNKDGTGDGSSHTGANSSWPNTDPAGAHSHTVNVNSGKANVSVTTDTTSLSVNNNGSSDFHENRPPYFAVQWYIKY